MREVVAWALSIVLTLMFMVVGGNIYLKIRNVLSKRPHKSDDEEDNPIVKFKDDLAEIYESNPNGKLKKLAQAVWNRVEEIEKWHNTEIKDIERRYYSAQCDVEELKDRCNKYNKELGEWYARYDNLKKKFAESEKCLNHSLEREANLRKANEGLHKQLKEEQEKNKIPIFSDQTEVPAYLINDNAFDSQINSFAKIILNTKPGEPLTATKAEEEVKRAIDMTAKPILIDTEELNEKLRNIWQKEAGKAVELPNTVKKKWPDDWVDAIEAARDPDKWPEYMAKVEGIPKNFNKYKVTLYDNKENETIETELYGANIYDALKSIDNERYSALGYRCI